MDEFAHHVIVEVVASVNVAKQILLFANEKNVAVGIDHLLIEFVSHEIKNHLHP